MLWSFAGAGGAVAGVVSASSDPMSFTSAAVANDMGAWAEVTAATARTSYGVTFLCRSPVTSTNLNSSAYVDIGVGGSGSERVIVEGIQIGFSLGNYAVFVPILIPGGVRLSVRVRAARTAQAYDGQLVLHYGQRDAWGRSTTYGINTAESGGVAMTAPGSINTKGAWTEITASTTAPIRYLLPTIQPANAATLTNNVDGLFDIGVGGSGSEVPIMSDMSFRYTTAESQTAPVEGLYVNIAAGSRLAARFAASATPQSPRITLIGVG